MLDFLQDVALSHVRDKGKSRCKLSYELFEEQDGYDPFIDISPFTRLIWLAYFVGVI